MSWSVPAIVLTVKYQCRGLRRLEVCTQHSGKKVQKYKEEEKSKKQDMVALNIHTAPSARIHTDVILSNHTVRSIMTSFIQRPRREREARLISPSESIVRGLLVLWFPAHICRGGVGFQWRPVLCHTGAPQIQFHALYAEHLPSA